MPRRGEMSDTDRFEQNIRDTASEWVVSSFTPGTSVRGRMKFNELDYAIQYGRQLLEDEVRVRSIMVYALDEYDHHALVGTINRTDMQFKEVKPKIY